MAEVYSVTATTTLTIATAKTVIELAAGAGVVARIVSVSISADQFTPNFGMRFSLVRFATTGTGTTYTPLKYNGEGQNRAAVCTAKVNDTVEPSTPVIVEDFYIPNTAGQMWQLPLGRELYVPPSTLLGLRCTSQDGGATVAANLIFEE